MFLFRADHRTHRQLAPFSYQSFFSRSTVVRVRLMLGTAALVPYINISRYDIFVPPKLVGPAL